VIVLDASALLALLFREEGHEAVAAVLDQGVLSAVNLAEVLGRFARDGHDPLPLRDRLLASPMAVIPFDDRQAALAASLLPVGAPLGLSLGDRACLALALERKLPVMTADRAWQQLRLPIDIRHIRRAARGGSKQV
jgi:PIN domain nuclease of toxin-antitoxin system